MWRLSCKSIFNWINLVALVAALTVVATTAQAQSEDIKGFVQGQRKVFDSKNHAKAKGVHVTLAYPQSWVAQESHRPNILQMFVSENGKGLENGSIIVIKPEPPLTKEEIEEVWKPGAVESVLPKGSVVINSRKTKIEGLPAQLIEYRISQERAGMSAVMQSLLLIFFYEGAMIQVQFNVGAKDTMADGLSLRMENMKPLFQLMLNSIVLPEKWK